MPVLVLVRHGHSTANEQGVLAGWTEGVGLTERGRSEAQAVGAHLREVTFARIVSSPLLRCRETAALLRPEARPQTVAGLGEAHYGAWTGRSLAELSGDPLWRTIQDEPVRACFPASDTYAAESMPQMAERVVGAVERIDAEVAASHGDDALWLAVSHGDPIKAIIAEAVGVGLGGLQRIHVDPGSVSIIRRHRGRSMLVLSNGTGDGLAQRLRARAVVPPGDATVGGGTG